MATLDQFARKMRILGRRVQTNAPDMIRRIGLAISQTLITSTPVDTGAARSNWQVGIGGPVAERRPSLGAGESATQPAISAAQAEIQEYQQGELWISNPLPYIGRLNEGSSSQAPAGFVEKAIDVAVEAVRNTRLLRP